MKDKLEVNMYVRIQWSNGEQTISKCTNKVDIGDTQYSNNDFYIHTDKKGEVIYKSMIVKASHNIMDLIQVGDVLIDKEGHKYPINYEFETDYNSEYGSYEITIDDNITLFFKDSLSIVTSQQFESMSYKLGDK